MCQLKVLLADEQHFGMFPEFKNPYMRGSTITEDAVVKCLQEISALSLYPVKISAKGRSIHTVPTGMNMLCSLLKRVPLLLLSHNRSH